MVGAGAVKGGSFGYRLQEKRMEAELTQLQAKVLGETLREISFLSPTWEHPMDIHVGPEAATPPPTHTHTLPPTHPPPLLLCLSFLVQPDVFITACTPPASQQMLCLNMAVSAQPRRRLPFKRLAGCHSDSRSSSCPTWVRALSRPTVRQIYIQ